MANLCDDQLSGDPGHLNRQYLDDHHVVARFLSGQLTEDESREFEEYMTANPDVVHDLEATARLKVGLHVLKETGELDSLLRPKSFFRDTRYALAASAALLALCALFYFRGGAPPTPKLFASMSALVDPRGHLLPLARTYAILRTRGNGYDALVELPATPQGIELRLLPENSAHPARYRVSLARVADDDSLTTVGSVAGLTPSANGFVCVYFDSSKLTRGRYQLTIRGDVGTDAPDAVSLFRIKLIPPTGI
jgi:hypothetical protein